MAASKHINAGRSVDGQPFLDITVTEAFDPLFDQMMVFQGKQDIEALRAKCNEALKGEDQIVASVEPVEQGEPVIKRRRGRPRKL